MLLLDWEIPYSEDVLVMSDLTSRTFDKLVSIGDDEVRIFRRGLEKGATSNTTEIMAAFSKYPLTLI